MSSVGAFLKQKKTDRAPIASAAPPLDEEQRKQANIFLGRLGKGVKAKATVIPTNQLKKTELPPPASAPTPTSASDGERDEDAPGSTEDKVAAEVEAAPADDLPSEDGEALFDGEPGEGHVPPDVRDFEPFEKAAAEATIYQSRRPHPVSLFSQLGKDFGRLSWAAWTPEQTWREIREKTGAAPSPVVRNMIGALRGLVESEAFWNEHHAFLWMAQALNGEVPDFSVLPELAPEQIAFAVHVAGQIRDGSPVVLPDKSSIPGVRYDEQVLATIAAIFHLAGLLVVPPPIPGEANEQIRRLQDAAAQAMARDVSAAWGKLEKRLDSGTKLAAEEFDQQEPLDLQLARLVSIWEYVNNPHAE